jgi:copper homeostasis protein|tara:strand:- start:63 stop:704 length:642 start_codon:yes stop_codon:yes gene_type:complete
MLEIATFTLEDAFAAAEAGADRIEVCQNYSEGGLTPPSEWVFALRQTVQIPVIAIVRPRKGGFHYSDEEVLEIQNQGHSLKSAGAQALVFGCLNKDSMLDMNTCKFLIKDWGLPAVLHRAFDECIDPFKTIDESIKSGFSRILTSKGSENIKLLQELKIHANNKIEILPGGGIRSANIDEYLNSGFSTIHSSAITGVKNKMDPGEIALIKLKV